MTAISLTGTYTYAIDYYSEDRVHLGSVALKPDWEPALECAHFRAIRRGLIAPLLDVHGSKIEPVWDAERGAPFLSAARVVVPAEEGDDSLCEEIPGDSTFFRTLASEGSTEMVEKGLLAKGQLFDYEICAYPTGTTAAETGGEHAGKETAHGASGAADLEGFGFEEVGEAIPLRERSLERLSSNARSAGYGADADDMRVFLPQQVLAEVEAASREAGDVEVGGYLIGHLARTPSSPEIFLEVTAQVLARHTDASAGRLTFTADSWSAARAAIDLRRRDELFCGWWHFHLDFCRACPEERKERCVMSRPFFSNTDVHMHRAVFPRAYQIALLVSDHGKESLDVSLFGWRHGSIVTRGFEIYPG